MSIVFIDGIIGTVILHDDEIDAIIVNEAKPIDVHHVVSNGKCYNVVEDSFKSHSDLKSFQTSLRGHKINWSKIRNFSGYKFANIDMVVCNVGIDCQVDSHLFNGEIIMVVFDAMTYETLSRDTVEQILNANIFTPRSMRQIKNKIDIKKIKSHTKRGLNLRLAIPFNEYNPIANQQNVDATIANQQNVDAVANQQNVDADANRQPFEVNGTVFY